LASIKKSKVVLLPVSHEREEGEEEEEIVEAIGGNTDAAIGGDVPCGSETSDKRASFPCKFNYKNKKCSKGKSCPYNHDLEPILCSKFTATGRCGKGMKCMFVHDKKMFKKSGDTGDGKDRELKKQCNKSQLNLPDPTQGTLLRKLLDNQIQEDENIELQCLHYIRTMGFFQTQDLLVSP
jgi:hypothetical protein